MPAHRASRGWFTVTIAALCVAAATPADASGRAVAIRDASRIVSVGGAVTEILYALGLESRVIAVDSTSLYPPRALAEKSQLIFPSDLTPIKSGAYGSCRLTVKEAARRSSAFEIGLLN
jgi:ABC-type Fe3+-hydroxamate transport system substrate-binding protein